MSLLEKITAIPLDLLPEGKARAQLHAEAHAGGPLIDIYTNYSSSDDYRAANGVGYIIERPLAGRLDKRWPAPEWIAWVEAGMLPTPCDFCAHTPATFGVVDHPLTDGRSPLICNGCNNAIAGRYGFTPHAIITCPKCGQVGLQVDHDINLCILCFTGRRG